MKKVILVSLIVFLFNLNLVSAYSEVSCSSDTTFSENSCNRCFDWWNKSAWDNLESLSDVWSNATDSDYVVFKWEQEMPKMLNLWQSNSSWVKSPSSVDFWEYTDTFNTLWSEAQQWYVLSAWWEVTWIRSKLWYTYNLETNTAPSWDNIGLLVYNLIAHKLLSTDNLDANWTVNKECILFKSWDAKAKTPVVPPKKLPQTGPAEYILLLILAMILGFTIVKSTRKS